jgi:hypothetical protein
VRALLHARNGSTPPAGKPKAQLYSPRFLLLLAPPTAEKTWPVPADAACPLDGIRYRPSRPCGNMISLQLADFGAEVIKVGPGQGDPLRDWRVEGLALKAYARNRRVTPICQPAPRTYSAAMRPMLIELSPGHAGAHGWRRRHCTPQRKAGDRARLGRARRGLRPKPGFGTLVEGMWDAPPDRFADHEAVLPLTALADGRRAWRLRHDELRGSVKGGKGQSSTCRCSSPSTR